MSIKRVTIELPIELYETFLNTLARKRSNSDSEAIRTIIKDTIRNEEKEVK